MAKCARCGQEFQPPDDRTNVCANCGDDLRAEEDANIAQAQAEAEMEALQRYESGGY